MIGHASCFKTVLNTTWNVLVINILGPHGVNKAIVGRSTAFPIQSHKILSHL